uniref:Uncharacterized protein n=1 Tax=Bracon brevicornis TaxID=1563983 RepID=A0A6V7KRN2_9HYME
MYRLRLFRKSTTLELRKHLVQALVFPILDYCYLVFAGLSAEISAILDRLLNYGVRFVFGLRLDEHVTAYRRRLGWMKCEKRRNHFPGCLTYKVLSSRVSNYLANLFSANTSSRPDRGDVMPLAIPRRYTVTLDKSFHVTASYLWNSLSVKIRNQPSFKTAFKTYILTDQLPRHHP